MARIWTNLGSLESGNIWTELEDRCSGKIPFVSGQHLYWMERKYLIEMIMTDCRRSRSGMDDGVNLPSFPTVKVWMDGWVRYEEEVASEAEAGEVW